MAKVTTFSIDDKTEKTLSELRTALGASSNAEVLRRAISLLGVASKVVQNDGSVILKSKDGAEREIVIN
jgi:hypothetical protein